MKYYLDEDGAAAYLSPGERLLLRYLLDDDAGSGDLLLLLEYSAYLELLSLGGGSGERSRW